MVLTQIPMTTLLGRFLLFEQKEKREMSYFCENSSNGVTSSNGLYGCFVPKYVDCIRLIACWMRISSIEIPSTKNWNNKIYQIFDKLKRTRTGSCTSEHQSLLSKFNNFRLFFGQNTFPFLSLRFSIKTIEINVRRNYLKIIVLLTLFWYSWRKHWGRNKFN